MDALSRGVFIVVLLLGNLLAVDDFMDLTENVNCDSYRSPVWSPDGEYIAFTGVCAGNRDILIIEINGNNILNLTNSPDVAELNPTWSPNGEYIAYDLRELFGRTDIWIVSKSGGTPRNLTAKLALGDRFSNSTPAWSPDGNFIAFTSENSKQSDIAFVNIETQEVTIITENLEGIFFQPKWSMDGKYLAFISLDFKHPGLWIVAIQTLQIEQLTALAVDKFSWSPADNSMICLIRGIESPINLIKIDGEISQFGDVVFSPNGPNGIANILWSSTGKYIAIEGIELKEDIWIVEIKTMSGVNITNSRESNDLEPSWSPDDTKMAFSSNLDQDSYNIWIVNVNGTDLRNLTGSYGDGTDTNF